MGKNRLFIVCCLLITVFLISCTAVRVGPPPPKGVAGVYHKVEKGQTLWRISRAYGVELERLSRINRLSDSSRIYAGQLIFIPGAEQTIEDLSPQISIDKGGNFIWPLKGKIVSFFGMKRDRVKNKGISIRAKKGSPVLAARSGKVAFCSEELKGYGKIVIIDHQDGYSTVYAHNSVNLVRLNQKVRQGQIIARVGNSGRVNRPELYFEIRKGHKPQNPLFYLP